MASTNFATIRHRCIDALYADRGIVRGTATSGSATAVTDTSAALPGSTVDHFDYAFIKITTTTDGLAPQGEVRAVSEGGWTNTGSWDVLTDFSAAVDTSDTYEIHFGPHPVWLDRLINKYARNFHYKTLWPLSLHIVLVDDNDFESASNGWITPVTGTEGKETTIVFNGVRSGSLTNAAANDYLTSAGDFDVVAGKSYYSSVMSSVLPNSDALFRMWDVTNNVSIEASATVGQHAWTELMFQWTVPTGCRRVQPRLVGVGANDITYWDDYQTWSGDSAIYPLPSWITRKEQIKDVVVYPQGTGSVGGDSDYRSNERQGQSIPWRFEREDYGALEEIHLWVPDIGMNRPYVICERPIAETTADYATTTANTIPIDSQTADLLVSGVLSEAFRELASRSTDSAHYEKQAKYHEGIWQNGMGTLKPREHKTKSNRVGVRQW